MKRELSLIFGLIIGILGTIGGWYMFLIIIGILEFPSFSVVKMIILLFGLTAMWAGALFYGPWILWEAIQNYRDSAVNEEEDCFEEDNGGFKTAK